MPTRLLDMVGSFFVSQIKYTRNGGGNAAMCKYWYNNHHIEVNLESRDDMECGPLPHYSGNHAVHQATNGINDDLLRVGKVHRDLDGPFQ